MKAWEVIGIAHDGELVCWNCMTKEEEKVARDEVNDDEITPVFASDENALDECCSRCGNLLWEST